MRDVGSKYDASAAQVAIAWSIAKGTVPIIGVTKTAHVEDAIKASEIRLTAQEILDLEAAAKETGTRSEVRGKNRYAKRRPLIPSRRAPRCGGFFYAPAAGFELPSHCKRLPNPIK
ncbi:hypothetical protein J19TS2_54320 [Cohnella xylanilytica]|nr:hypothetical protein J19TS2_54320 [Cohnella xylanilytica]